MVVNLWKSEMNTIQRIYLNRQAPAKVFHKVDHARTQEETKYTTKITIGKYL